ncbi:hypothetical protein C8J56DRAFT_1025621 [Mycena floridula]|nr:hypothetical protein C8J56DRAFT_1025621 [Mycena floridula]
MYPSESKSLTQGTRCMSAMNQLRVTEQAEKEMTDKHGSLRYLPSSHIRSLTHALNHHLLPPNHHLLRPNPPLGVDAGGSKKSRALRYPVRGDYAAEEDGSPVPGTYSILPSHLSSQAYTPTSKEAKKAVTLPVTERRRMHGAGDDDSYSEMTSDPVDSEEKDRMSGRQVEAGAKTSRPPTVRRLAVLGIRSHFPQLLEVDESPGLCKKVAAWYILKNDLGCSPEAWTMVVIQRHALTQRAPGAVLARRSLERSPVTDGVNIHLLQCQIHHQASIPVQGAKPAAPAALKRHTARNMSVQAALLCVTNTGRNHQRNANATYRDEVERTNRMGDANEDEEGEGDGEQARKIEVVKFLGLSSGFSVM